MSNFYRITNGWSKDVPRSTDLYELITVGHIPGRTGPLATIRLVTGHVTKQISTDYLLNVSEEEVRECLCDLRIRLLEQAEAVMKSLNKI